MTCIVTSEGDECCLTGVDYSSDGQVVFEGGYSELANEAVTKLLETGKDERESPEVYLSIFFIYLFIYLFLFILFIYFFN